MEIRFYKDTLTESQIIALLLLDDNFKIDGQPIIEYRQKIKGCGWFDESGTFSIYQNKQIKEKPSLINKNTYIQLHPYVKFNDKQKSLYQKFIIENYSVKICPYWILNNDEEKQLIVNKIGKFQDLKYEYPFIVGKEGSFTFQEKNTTLEDYVSHDNKTIYKYELQTDYR